MKAVRKPADSLAIDLDYAEAGQVHFDRTVCELGDDRLRGSSLLPGWTRAHVIAHVGFNARALTRLVDWARTDIEHAMYESADARNREIDCGAPMSSAELRRLNHVEAHALTAAWRAMPDDRWAYEVSNAQGARIPVRDTVWMRARELWLHAVDLDHVSSDSDVPAAVQRRIVQNVLDTWATRDGHRVHASVSGTGELLEPLPSPTAEPATADPRATVSGSLPNLMLWATGRRHAGVSALDSSGREIGEAPTALRWL